MSEHGAAKSRTTGVQRRLQGRSRDPLPDEWQVGRRDLSGSRSDRVCGASLGGPGRDRRRPARGPHQRRARGTRPSASRGARAARGARHLEAGHGFLRQGDPVNVYPFIEAEKQGQGNVRRACALLRVSRAAYYAWSAVAPEDRRRRDDELLAAIKDVHRASRGTYGAPRITRALRKRGLRVSRKRVARLMAGEGI